jgi:hypothetical protein
MAAAEGMPKSGISSLPGAGGAAPGAAPVGGPAAQQGSTFLQRMAAQYGQMAQKVAPALRTAGAVATGPVGVGTVAALAPRNLNTGESETLAKMQQFDQQIKTQVPMLPPAQQQKYNSMSPNQRASMLISVRQGLPLSQAIDTVR